MTNHFGKLVLVLILLTVFSFGDNFAPVNVWAQAEGSSLAKQVQGTWLLVSNINERDGQKIDTFGPNPRGQLILTPGGHFSMILMRASLPKFASNNRLKGTVEENQAVVQGSHAFFGIRASSHNPACGTRRIFTVCQPWSMMAYGSEES